MLREAAKPTLLRRLDGLARDLLPFAASLLLVLVGAVPTGLPGYQEIAPSLALAAVFYWSIYRPDLMPSIAVFALGAIQDTLTGTPLGVGALIFVLTHGLAVSQRRAFVGKPFFIAWIGFAIVCFGALIASTILCSLLKGAPMLTLAAPMQALLTLALFPGIAGLMIGAHRHLLRN
ncbi:MAG: rod shape-determining protein MreD [Thalassobaculales bacterium]